MATATDGRYDRRAPVRMAQEKHRRKERARVMLVNTIIHLLWIVDDGWWDLEKQQDRD